MLHSASAISAPTPATSSAAPSSTSSSSSTSGIKTVYFIRHGETTFNRAHIYQGQTNASALTGRGKLGAKLVGRYLRENKIQIDKFYTSQLTRAKQTFDGICTILPHLQTLVSHEAILNEREQGRVEGKPKTFLDVVHAEPEVAKLIQSKQNMTEEEYDATYQSLTGIEGFTSLRKRGHAALDMLASSPHENIAVIGHGRFLATLFTQIDGTFGEKSDMPNCTITKCRYDPTVTNGNKKWTILNSYFGTRLFQQDWLQCSQLGAEANTYLEKHGKEVLSASSSSSSSTAASPPWYLSLPPSHLLVCYLRVKSHRFLVMLHPKDRRGYRSIVRLWSTQDPVTPDALVKDFNRTPTLGETQELLLATSIVARAWSLLSLVPQISVAGNNSHSIATTESSSSSPMLLGTSSEPAFLHAHVLCRGVPTHDYVLSGIPLAGPLPGKEFNLRGEVEGDAQVPWQSEEQAKTLAQILKELIDATLEDVNEKEELVKITAQTC